MTVIVYLLPAALLMGLLGLIAFLWCLKTRQYDDLEGAAYRSLLDAEPEQPAPKPSINRR
jgi:cbb3-type cytochrome oxidase maturation protein